MTVSSPVTDAMTGSTVSRVANTDRLRMWLSASSGTETANATSSVVVSATSVSSKASPPSRIRMASPATAASANAGQDAQDADGQHVVAGPAGRT